MSSRGAEIERVARQLDALLDDLGASVAALSSVLTRATPPDQQGTDDERLAKP